MLPAAIAALGLAISAGSSIYGAAKSGAENRKANRLVNNAKRQNQAWWEVKKNEPYTLRADVQAAIKKQRELLNEQYGYAQNKAVVSGASDESVALHKEAANKALSNTMTDIAAQSSAYKDAAERDYRNKDLSLTMQQVAQKQAQAQQVAAAAGQAANAGMSLAGNAISMGTKAPATNTGAGGASTKALGSAAETTASAQAALDNTIRQQALDQKPEDLLDLPASRRKIKA